jgi:hypothetical protein
MPIVTVRDVGIQVLPLVAVCRGPFTVRCTPPSPLPSSNITSFRLHECEEHGALGVALLTGKGARNIPSLLTGRRGVLNGEGKPGAGCRRGSYRPCPARSGVAERPLGIVLAEQLVDCELDKFRIVFLEPDPQ